MRGDARLHELLVDHALGLLGPEEVRRLEAEMAASPELRAEADALRNALYSLPAALEPESPAPGAWQALLARVRQEGIAVRPGPAPAAAAPAPARRRPVARPVTRAARPLTVALAAAVLLLAGSVGWGALQYRRAARQAHEQAVVAYWMRVPGMKVVPLETVEGAPAGVRPGIVCLLPDGRAMVLQPHPAPAGGDYLLYGVTGDGTAADTSGDRSSQRVELGRTRGTLIEFHADGLTGVELALPGPTGGVVARASLR